MITPSISLADLQKKLLDPNVPERELRPYLELDESASAAFDPSVRVALEHVADRGEEAAVLLGSVNRIARWRRRARYENRIAGGWTGRRIVSEGDSWFQYPFLLEDVIDWLDRDQAIWCAAGAGDLLEDMVRQDEILAAIGEQRADALLLSGGGNDLLGGGNLATYLRLQPPGRSPGDHVTPEFEVFLQKVLDLYGRLFSTVTGAHPDVPIFCHGYDYAVPVSGGRWLGRPMASQGITDPGLQAAIIRWIIDRFDEALQVLTRRFPGVVFIDCRGVVEHWHDELHPDDASYGKVAERFRESIAERIRPGPTREHRELVKARTARVAVTHGSREDVFAVPIFGSQRAQTLVHAGSLPTLESATQSRVGQRFGAIGARGERIEGPALEDQFLVFQFDGETGAIVEPSQSKARHAGSEQEPDAKATLQLASFHLSSAQRADSTARATLRIDFGKDEASSSHLDTLFWSIAAGLQLYDQVQQQRTSPKELQSDFQQAFARRPVEIPGALGRLSFEVVKHEEPPWWRKAFQFLRGGTGQALTAAFGFPAVTPAAVGFLDELLTRVLGNDSEVLFRSRPLTLALTQRARDDFAGGVPSVEVGVLNPGFALLARGRDFALLRELRPVYMSQLGLLRPGAVSMDEFLRTGYVDPFSEVTYAVLKVGTAPAKLEQGLEFRG